MRRYLIAFALLAGCDGGSTGADGYRYEGAEYRRDEVLVRIVTHADLHELQRAGQRQGAVVEPNRDLQAFAVIEPGGAVCTLHMVDPATRYRPEWIGHEMAHCAFGRWHR